MTIKAPFDPKFKKLKNVKDRCWMKANSEMFSALQTNAFLFVTYFLTFGEF